MAATSIIAAARIAMVASQDWFTRAQPDRDFKSRPLLGYTRLQSSALTLTRTRTRTRNVILISAPSGVNAVNIQTKAALRATLVVGVWAALMLVPFVYVITLIVFMLPLWILHGMGIPGLGSELNGFFVPSAIGWTLAAGLVWLLAFWLFHRRQRRATTSPA